MTEPKYYTPILEEFHIGFEFEINDYCLPPEKGASRDANIWHKEIFMNNMPLTYGVIYSNLFRVKYLDREDIESLGWEWIQNNKFVYTHNKIYKLQFFNDSHKIHIYTHEQTEHTINSEWLIIWEVKNKSELKRIMKQLNIK